MENQLETCAYMDWDLIPVLHNLQKYASVKELKTSTTEITVISHRHPDSLTLLSVYYKDTQVMLCE